MYYDKRYNEKPDVWETIKIQGYTSKNDGIYHTPLLVSTEIEIEELAKDYLKELHSNPPIFLVARIIVGLVNKFLHWILTTMQKLNRN